MSELLASVIVPVRNGGAHVGQLLESLGRQSIRPGRFEVVIGDDGSSDGALDGVEAGRPWLRVVSGPPRNSYEARNRAVRASRAPVLALCDVDCRPEPGWLEAGLASLAGADVAGGCVRFVVVEPASVWALIEAEASIDQRRQVSHKLMATANVFLRRELFDRVGGFDESLPSGGDWEFARRCARAGATFVYASEAVVTHPADGAAFIRRLWFRARWAATRRAMDGARPDLVSAILPGLRFFRRRRSLGRPLVLDRRRLEEQGIEAPRGPALQLRVAAARYILASLIVWAARVVGWTDGLVRRALVRRRREAEVGSRAPG
jgi:glycosyltransferase involved in cell wall biosynthesis